MSERTMPSNRDEPASDVRHTELPDDTQSKGQYALALIKAAIAGIPAVGGPIASLLGDYIEAETNRRIREAIHHLGERLNQLGSRVDVTLVNKDEFLELFKTCYLTIVRSHHDEKIRAAANLIANLLLREGDQERLEYRELDHFARSLHDLSLGAIGVLAAAVELARPNLNKLGASPVTIDFGALQRRSGVKDPALLMGLLSELNGRNLVHLRGAPSIAVANYANYPVEMSPLGVRFVEFVIGDRGHT